MADKWAEFREALDLGLSHDNIRSALADCLQDCYPGEYPWICDVYGDAESGDVVYRRNGETLMAPYSISMVGDKRKHEIDVDQAKDVLPRLIYDEEVDEGDDYAAMESAGLYLNAEAGRPLCERFVSKAERDAADEGSFAGKGKSFPILKPADIMAAVRSLGRAGAKNIGTDKIKANIIRIANAKGWSKYLPAAWRSKDKASEAAPGNSGEPGEVVFAESADFLNAPLIEAQRAQADYPVVLIKPGRGTSGYYTEAVLKRDGPSIFKAGTHMYWNHATDVEESARPEGDLNNLAAVLTGNAYWDANGRDGAGLYGKAKVFSDFADRVAEKAPHTGLSIKARGRMAEAATLAPDGKPGLVTALTRADSVDFVTRAGRGGKVLTEAARPQSQQTGGSTDMDQQAEIARLTERLNQQDAIIASLRESESTRKLGDRVDRILEALEIEPQLKAATKRRAITESLAVTGEIADDKLRESVLRIARELVELVESVSPTGRVRNLGESSGAAAGQQQQTQQAQGGQQQPDHYAEAMGNLAEIFVGGGEGLQKRFKEGRAA